MYIISNKRAGWNKREGWHRFIFSRRQNQEIIKKWVRTKRKA